MDGATLPEEEADEGLETKFEIRFPESKDDDRDQDKEWCEVRLDGEWRRIRFHDYDEIYSIPGLYEQLFYVELRCQSPLNVREVVAESLAESELSADELRVLDVGAGNGLVGVELDKLGVESITGVDIIEEAAVALERDRPALYEDYFVVDLTDVPPEADDGLRAGRYNCLTCVAALGFDDIPPEAFIGGYQYLVEGGLIAISIKADFVSGADRSGFAQMISAGVDDGSLNVLGTRRYVHRISATGEPIDYVAIVAEKRGPLKAALREVTS